MMSTCAKRVGKLKMKLYDLTVVIADKLRGSREFPKTCRITVTHIDASNFLHKEVWIGTVGSKRDDIENLTYEDFCSFNDSSFHGIQFKFHGMTIHPSYPKDVLVQKKCKDCGDDNCEISGPFHLYMCETCLEIENEKPV